MLLIIILHIHKPSCYLTLVFPYNRCRASAEPFLGINLAWSQYGRGPQSTSFYLQIHSQPVWYVMNPFPPTTSMSNSKNIIQISMQQAKGGTSCSSTTEDPQVYSLRTSILLAWKLREGENHAFSNVHVV